VAPDIDTRDLIGAAEAAEIIGLSHATSVTTYLRRYPDFPRPVVDLSKSRVRLWRRQDIVKWCQQRSIKP
jgi:predicted DNA-binding transcriptional regulator AlpA